MKKNLGFRFMKTLALLFKNVKEGEHNLLFTNFDPWIARANFLRSKIKKSLKKQLYIELVNRK